MSGIGDFFKVAASVTKLNRNEPVRKNEPVRPSSDAAASSKTTARQDNAQISEAARDLLTLRQDAQRYVDEVQQGETLSENDIRQLKQKIENKYFIKDEVVDTIVDKLVDLPNFLIQPNK